MKKQINPTTSLKNPRNPYTQKKREHYCNADSASSTCLVAPVIELK